MAAGAMALPYYVPAAALGRGGAVSPSERIVMGGIGIGGRGSYDLGWMLNEPDVQWVAVCDVQKSRREAAKKVVDSKYGNKDCAVYGDLRKFLAERTDVDLRFGFRSHLQCSWNLFLSRDESEGTGRVRGRL